MRENPECSYCLRIIPAPAEELRLAVLRTHISANWQKTKKWLCKPCRVHLRGLFKYI